MIWHDHSKLVGEHAFLGASKYHWLNYTDDQMIAKYKSSYWRETGDAKSKKPGSTRKTADCISDGLC